MFERIWTKTEKNKKAAAYNKTHVLKVLIICVNCGHKMTHSWSPGRPKYTCQYRRSIGKPEGYIKSIRDEDLEPLLLEMIRDKIRNRMDMADVLKEESERDEKNIVVCPWTFKIGFICRTFGRYERVWKRNKSGSERKHCKCYDE